MRKVYSRWMMMALLLCCTTLSSLAQDLPVTLRILAEKNKALPFASVKITARADSLDKQDKVADSNGVVKFTLKKNSQYIVTVSAVGYLTLEKGLLANASQQVYSFTLQSESKTMGNVVVRSSKPLMRQEEDKTIVDPEVLASSSTNAYEIMEKTPGLFVDQDGNIYLSSTTPAAVQINGREMKMSAADIATILKSLPPNAIQRIEILRTPSAREDASSSGGLVNVVLKKGVKIGLTGSINTGFNQGVYGNRFAGININNNNGVTSSYINFFFGNRESYEEIRTDRNFAPDSLLTQDAFTRYRANTPFLSYGISRDLSKKWDMSFDGRISYNRFNNITENESFIKKQSTAALLSDNIASVQNKGYSLNTNQGLTFKYKIDSLGSEWRTDLSYAYQQNNSDQFFNTAFLLPLLPGIGGDGDIMSRRHLYVLQSDLKWKLPQQLTVEFGIKSSNMRFRSETEYFSERTGIRSKDPFRTNTYNYNEGIHAAYVQGTKTYKGLVLKTGVRMEHTNMQGRQRVPFDTSFSVRRTDFFPYVYLSRNIMKIAGYDMRAYLIYRRTINRPVYEYLNPFPRFIDQYLFETGNPSLRPQFTQNFEMNVSVDETPVLALGVNNTKDIFTNVIYQADTSKSLAYRTYDNLGTNRETYFRLLGALPPGGKYFFVAGAQYTHNNYKGLYENKPINFSRGSWSFFTYHQLKLGRNTQLSLNGFVRLNGQLQFYEIGPFANVNTTITQYFMKKKLSVSLSGNDLFFTNNNTFRIQQGTVSASGYRQSDTRRVGLQLRYNFGIRKKEEQQNILNTEQGNN